MGTRICPVCSDPLDGTRPAARATVNRKHGRSWSRRVEAVHLDCVRGDDGRWNDHTSDDGKLRVWPSLTPADAQPVPCQVCGLPVVLPPDKRRRIVTCSDTCRARHYARPAVTPTQHVCGGCGQAMTGRPDRRFCSSACRQRAYRRRQALVRHGIDPTDADDVDTFGQLDTDQLDAVLRQARTDGDLSAAHVATLARDLLGQP